MNIETVLLIVIVTFACGFVLDRWNVRLILTRSGSDSFGIPKSAAT